MIEGLSGVKVDKEHIIRRRVSLAQTLLDRARNAGSEPHGGMVARRIGRYRGDDSGAKLSIVPDFMYHLSEPT